MEYFVQTFMYLIAVFGIIFTTISLCELFDLNRYINNTYRIFSKDDSRKNSNKNVSVVIKIRGLDDEEEKNLIKEINDGNVDLKSISNNIVVQKEE